MLQSTIETIVGAFLAQTFGYCQKEKGYFEMEMFADYDDEIPERTVLQILADENPEASFYDTLEECFTESRWREEDSLLKRVIEECFNDSVTAEDEEQIREYLNEHFSFTVPAKHYLKQTFCVNVMMDTGDGNYDYTLNSIYPCWDGRDEHVIDKKASLLWLAKTQGYTKRRFQDNMKKGDLDNPVGFLKTCRQELANLPSHMSTVTFLVKMTLEQLMELNRLINLQDRNGHFYDTTKNPDCGYLMLGKKTTTGLYDPWSGGGSVFEIELERDVKVPIKFIRSALPDGGDGYSIQSVYDMCSSAWTETLQGITVPNQDAA